MEKSNSTISNGGRGLNLYYDPWCPVVKISTGECKEVSFSDALLNAKDYMLSAATVFEQVTILRNLCALAGTLLYRYDSSGTEASVKDADDAIKRWENAYIEGFSKTAVKNYGEKWKDHFFLHDEKLPFYQTPGLYNAKDPKSKTGIYCVSKLNPLVFESNNKEAQFTIVRGKNKSILTEAELARGLMFIQAFNDNASKSEGAGMSWPGHRTVVFAEGQNLLETILLNTPMVDSIMELWDGMTPDWEKDERPIEPTFSNVVPRNPAMMFTAQSRRIELLKEKDYEYGISRGGDIYDGIKEKSGKKKPIESPMNDPMIVCNLEDPPTVKGQIGNNMWLVCVDSLLKAQNKAAEAGDKQEKNEDKGATQKQKKIGSGLFNWLWTVVDFEDTNISTSEVRLNFVSLQYKGAMQSSFERISTTSSIIRLGINNDEEWRDFITEEVANINAISMIIGGFEMRINLAVGNEKFKYWAQPTFMDYCREPFEKLVCYSKPGTDKEKLKKAWNRKVKAIVDDILAKLLDRLNINNAGIQEIKPDKNKPKVAYSPGEVFRVKENIWNILRKG